MKTKAARRPLTVKRPAQGALTLPEPDIGPVQS
jgi:hypothetical protein